MRSLLVSFFCLTTFCASAQFVRDFNLAYNAFLKLQDQLPNGWEVDEFEPMLHPEIDSLPVLHLALLKRDSTYYLDVYLEMFDKADAAQVKSFVNKYLDEGVGIHYMETRNCFVLVYYDIGNDETGPIPGAEEKKQLASELEKYFAHHFQDF
jgi:hypothetical protein